MKGILLWLIGIPIPIIILLYIFNVFRPGGDGGAPAAGAALRKVKARFPGRPGGPMKVRCKSDGIPIAESLGKPAGICHVVPATLSFRPAVSLTGAQSLDTDRPRQASASRDWHPLRRPRTWPPAP